MTKERVNISLDEKLLKKARNELPNLSGFVEECLKHYFGYANGTFPIGNINEITDKIGKLQVELFLINQNYDAKESIERAENEKVDKIWRLVWYDYRQRLTLNPTTLPKAVELLEIDEETLEDVMDWLHETTVLVDSESWKNVYEKYKEETEE